RLSAHAPVSPLLPYTPLFRSRYRARTTTLGSRVTPLSEPRPRLSQHAAQDALDLVELGWTDRQRRGQLDDGVASVVGAAVQASVDRESTRLNSSHVKNSDAVF